jgi:hypothetical protein
VRDPHVERLHYEIGTGEGISYRDPAAVEFCNKIGRFQLRDGRLFFEAIEHFSAEEEARAAVEPFLRGWEMEADLTSNVGTIRFRFLRAELIDRDPPGPEECEVISLKAASLVLTAAGSVTVHLTCNKYPEPPRAFRTTPEVELGYRRWLGFRAGKEPLQSMAYFVLTLLASNAGNPNKAARVFQIEPAVLSTMGRLSSTKGDGITARKVQHGKLLQDLTGTEKHWLEQAVRRLIRRLGEHASGVPLNMITMQELPRL